jgi:3-oxoacyl-[acyl-carrier protein] reductase
MSETTRHPGATTAWDFTGQTALVTGGTRGIGRAVSEALLDAGASVIAAYGGDDAAADAFREANGARADRLRTVRLDVADYAAVEAFFRGLQDAGGTLEILVNNAGIRRDSVLAMMAPADWERVLAVNLTGAYHCAKFAVQAMMTERYGRIVNVTSPSGRFGFEGQANYAASKAGMVALTRSLSKEVARRGITVNCVSPGFIDTDLLADLPGAQAKAYRESVPLRRFGTAGEVAHATLFLAARESAYVTGSVLEVTGGL